MDVLRRAQSMVFTPTLTKTSEGGILRVHAQGEVTVSSIRDFLAKMEHAYNSSFVFDQLVEQTQQIGQRTNNSPPLPIGALLWNSWWPPTEEKVAAFVPDDKKLVLKGVVLQSPGFWDFVGSLNPLQMLLTYLNERHERQKDFDYRNAADRDRLNLENKLLENKVIQERIDILKQVGATDNDIAILKSQLLGQSLQALGEMQDRALVSNAEIVNEDEQNPVSAESSSLLNLFGKKLVSANPSDTYLTGSKLSDTMFSSMIPVDKPGDDILSGEEGSDILSGEEGSDFLSGGEGSDCLDIGEGNKPWGDRDYNDTVFRIVGETKAEEPQISPPSNSDDEAPPSGELSGDK